MTGPRTVLVKPPSAAEETVQVFQSLVLIAVVALFVGSVGRTRAADGIVLASYQVKFQERGGNAQRVYRELGAALEEILVLHDADPARSWPGVEQLAAEAVEPFGPPAVWERRVDSGVINYVGRDARDGSSPYYLLSIVEPPPGTTGAEGHFGPLDETHRKLGSGAFVHVGIWFNAKPRPEAHALEYPQRAGWTEIVNAAPERSEERGEAR